MPKRRIDTDAIYPFHTLLTVSEFDAESGYDFSYDEIDFIEAVHTLMKQAQDIMDRKINARVVLGGKDPGGAYVSETWKSFFKRD